MLVPAKFKSAYVLFNICDVTFAFVFYLYKTVSNAIRSELAQLSGCTLRYGLGGPGFETLLGLGKFFIKKFKISKLLFFFTFLFKQMNW